MIHDLEIILHLVRSPVKSIDAVGVPVLSKGEDIANARIRFENGCVANVTASRISPEKMRKIRVFQQDAYLSLDYQNQSGEMFRLVNGMITREPVEIDKDEPLKRELESFVECSRRGIQPVVSGSEAAAALNLAIEITEITRLATGELVKELGQNDAESVTSVRSASVRFAWLLNRAKRGPPCLLHEYPLRNNDSEHAA